MLGGCVTEQVIKQQYYLRPAIFFDVKAYSGLSYVEYAFFDLLERNFIERGYVLSTKKNALYQLEIIIEHIDSIETIVNYDVMASGNFKQISVHLIIKKSSDILLDTSLVFEGLIHESDDFLWKERYEITGLDSIYDMLAVRIESLLYSLL
ncbi:hypothetical protein COB28_01430 [Candidatus Dependentiae bacterium]|nr:MAG: hypothetical protein COB28_01430 [Candidatus Dependentiae bacterium]